MNSNNARENSRIAQLGKRDADREMYRATHTGKHARKFVMLQQKGK